MGRCGDYLVSHPIANDKDKKSSTSTSSRYLTGTLGTIDKGFLSNVLGVRKVPSTGVLGERMSPVTGDDLTLNFWIMLLGVAGLIAMHFVYADDDEPEEDRA